MGCLNPYSAGSETAGGQKSGSLFRFYVLILILLEVRLLEWKCLVNNQSHDGS